MGATDAKTENKSCLTQYDSWCESESIRLQTELEPALPYHFKLSIRLLHVPKILFTRFASRLRCTAWKIEKLIASPRL